MAIDREYLINISKELLAIPSPVGYCDKVIARVEEELKKFNVSYKLTKKNAIIATIKGKDSSYKKMISAHVDTIGAMVKKIKNNGRLELVNLGGINWAGVEGENLTIHTMSGKIFTGTLVPNKASVHIYGDDARDIPRTPATMEVRIDEEVSSKSDTENLGIAVGDFVAFEPRTIITENGYFKSRFIDDKVCVAQVLTYIKFLIENNLKPNNDLYIYISNFEEIGHGVSLFPEDLDEFIALDIGLVGEDALGDEKKVSISAKDNKTPYSLDIRKKMVEICQNKKIGYTVDVYNRYGSDASAAILQGFDFKIACIGPSVEASHHYERTHIDGIVATINLLIEYL